MKKRAFVVQVSGVKYESFLPDYIYFSHKAYPESAVIVLYEEELIKKTISALNFLRSIGCEIILKKVDFREYLKMDTSLRKRFIYRTTGVFKCCGRFLIDIPEFHKFDELYIGDVDLFIMKEEKNLFDEHYIHSKFLGVPYSDILRKPFCFEYSFRKRIKSFIKYGKYYKISFKNKPKKFYLNKMTGLRYIQVDEYFKKVSPLFKQFIDMFDCLFSSSASEIDNEEILTPTSFDDQQIVCLLMKKAFGFLPQHSNSDGIDEHNPESFDYRPHHGIHIKLFLDLAHINERIVFSNDYKNYLIQYKRQLTDDDYVRLSSYRFGFCKKLTNNLLKFIRKTFDE